MRTTLTLDDDLARRLRQIARASGQSLKKVINEAIRRGLSLGEAPPPNIEPFVVTPQACGFRPGIDPARLNQLYDELELEGAAARIAVEVHEP
jgi:hypothetical protein